MTGLPMIADKKVIASHAESARPLRILAVSHTWEGANDYSYVRAFRRAGHSVTVASDEGFIPPGWRNPALKAARRLLLWMMVAEFNRHLIDTALSLRPNLLLVYKGTHVSPAALSAIKETGAVAINIYPDTNFALHSSLLSQTMQLYDWVFTTKSFHIGTPPVGIDGNRLSFLPHCYDPEVHRPIELDQSDRAKYGADIACVTTWTPRKELLISALRARLPDLTLKVWGNLWERSRSDIGPGLMRRSVNGVEYSKAVQAAKITLAPLVEKMGDAMQGDLVTARTFEIPAASGFMMHMRTAEAAQYFEEGRECVMFDDINELVEKTLYFLANPEERSRIAGAGLLRCISSEYSVDDRVKVVLAKYNEIK